MDVFLNSVRLAIRVICVCAREGRAEYLRGRTGIGSLIPNWPDSRLKLPANYNVYKD